MNNNRYYKNAGGKAFVGLIISLLAIALAAFIFITDRVIFVFIALFLIPFIIFSIAFTIVFFKYYLTRNKPRTKKR